MTIEALYSIFQEYPSIQTDTRKLKSGDLFFALKGPSFNGNSFAAQAIAAGATYAIIDEEAFVSGPETILVDDVLTTLQELALHHRKQFNIPFIAITGSNGKTTTKELIHAVLTSAFHTFTTEGNLNNHIGIPLTILKVKKEAQIAVIEMGANHQKEIASYCTYTLPTHGVITNCGKAHLEGFGGVEGVRKGKGELYDYLRSNDGTAFVMWDYDYLQTMSKGIKEIITYGTKDASLNGHALISEPFLEIKIDHPSFPAPLQTQLVGAYNLPNVLVAVTIGLYLNVSADKIKSAIESYAPSNSRSQLVQWGTNQVILDAYNANPSSMRLAIENFGNMKQANKVLLLGGMAELGDESMEEHQAIIDLIQKYEWKNVVLVGGDFLKIKHPFLSFNNSTDAAKWVKEQNFQNAHLLVKGSRSMKMEAVVS